MGSEDELNPIDVLAAEFAERLKSGEQPTVEEYAKAHPEHADTIRAMFPSIRMMERVGKRDRVEHEFDKRTQMLTGRDGKMLGDFRILREVGRGGMGIVYEALQQSLRRRVALKVLAPHISDSETQLKRFHREAKSAARLHHTNIVPVYGVGESDGLHFIAMQFIEGITLQEKVENATTRADNSQPDVARTVVPASGQLGSTEVTTTGPLPQSTTSVEHAQPIPRREASDSLREAARIVRDTANALAYAHEHGVHHRDIKPGNLLLDEAGTVWITDFGLAKHESDEAATQTGDIVGTIRYMAPEQFSGQEDARSDIYSLGMTLYELLTNQPAYPAMKTVALMKLKTDEPPPCPGDVVKHLPADLDTITLKACATDPKHRYQTAAELEEDLARFLEDRPILARRVSPLERLWRWARRNPIIAALSTATALLLAAMAVVFAVGNYNTRTALDKANAANRRAEKNLATALDAFEQIMANISSRGDAQSLAIDVDGEEFTTSVVTAADADLLQTLLEFFDEFSRENSTDLSQKRADALVRAGTIQMELGRTDDARAAYSKSLSIYQEIAQAESESDEDNVPSNNITLELARTHRHLMRLAAQAGDNNEILSHFRQSRALLQTSKTASSNFELALTLSALSSAAVDTKSIIMETVGPLGGPRGGRRGPGAGPGTGQGRRRRKGPGGRPVRGAGSPEQRPGPPGNLRREMRLTGPLARAATDAVTEAIEILERLVSVEPNNREFRLELGRVQRHSIEIHRDPEAKNQAVSSAIEQFQWLVDHYPETPLFRYELATTQTNRVAESGSERALRSLEAIRIAGRLVAAYPGVPQYEVLLAKALGGRNGIRDPGPERIDGWKQIANIYRKLHQRYPSSSVYRLTLASTLRSLARDTSDEDPETTKKTIREAIDLLEETQSSTRGQVQDFVNAGLLRDLQEISESLDRPRPDIER